MINLTGYVRNKSGTNFSRLLRSQGKFPAVIYKKNSSSLLISLDQNELLKIFKKVKNFKLQQIKISFSEKSFFTKILDIQFHSFKNMFLHIDFAFI